MCLRIQLSAGLASRSGSCPVASRILMPVNTRNAPNKYMIQWNWAISQVPTRVITARSTIDALCAPRLSIAKKSTSSATRANTTNIAHMIGVPVDIIDCFRPTLDAVPGAGHGPCREPRHRLAGTRIV